MDIRVGSVVISKAGRDKGKFLAVVEMTDEGIFVCDGRGRPLDNPKRKNPRHLAATKVVLSDDDTASNRALIRALSRVAAQSPEEREVE